MAGRVTLPRIDWRAWWPPSWLGPDCRPEDALPYLRVGGVVGAAMQRLEPEHQHLIALRFGRGYSVAQVARAVHRPKGEVRMLQLLALRALQRELESHAS